MAIFSTLGRECKILWVRGWCRVNISNVCQFDRRTSSCLRSSLSLTTIQNWIIDSDWVSMYFQTWSWTGKRIFLGAQNWPSNNWFEPCLGRRDIFWEYELHEYFYIIFYILPLYVNDLWLLFYIILSQYFFKIWSTSGKVISVNERLVYSVPIILLFNLVLNKVLLHSFQLGVKPQVFFYCQIIEQYVILGTYPKAISNVVHTASYVFPINVSRAWSWWVYSSQEGHGRGLSCAIVPQKRSNLAGIQI